MRIARPDLSQTLSVDARALNAAAHRFGRTLSKVAFDAFTGRFDKVFDLVGHVENAEDARSQPADVAERLQRRFSVKLDGHRLAQSNQDAIAADVANEVKKLANDTGVAARTIVEVVDAIRQASEESAKSVGLIVAALSTLEEGAQAITTEVERQGEVAADIASGIENASHRVGLVVHSLGACQWNAFPASLLLKKASEDPTC